jgi:hypothetical protein
MRGSAAFRTAIAPGGVLTGPWVRNELWRRARAVPRLDLRLAETKTLTDAVSGQNLVTFTRASSGTYVGSDGLIKTATTNEARFDHNPTTGESLGLLVEEQRTNSFLQSQDFSTSWSNVGSSENTNVSLAPDGTQTADALVDTAINETHNLTQSVPGLAGSTAHTFSCFMKKGSKNHGVFVFAPNSSWAAGAGASVFFDLNNGTVGTSTNATATIQALPNGWYRCTATATTVATPGTATMRIGSSLTGTAQTYTGAGDEAIYLWGAQLEAGSFPTSYIPTTTATVTRSADVASITGANFSNWYNHSEGTLLATAGIRGGNTVVSSGLAIINSIAKLAETAVTVNARNILFNTSVSPNRYGAVHRSSTANIAINDNSYEAIQFGKYYNLSTSYVNNSTQGLALSVDGRTVITNATAVDVPVPTRLLIGAGNAGSNSGVGIDEYYLNGTIKRLTYWPQRLSNSTLQEVTR